MKKENATYYIASYVKYLFVDHNVKQEKKSLISSTTVKLNKYIEWDYKNTVQLQYKNSAVSIYSPVFTQKKKQIIENLLGVELIF